MINYNNFIDSANIMSDSKPIEKVRPATGYPLDAFLSVSICTGFPVTAEILSTALLACPEKNRNIKKRLQDVEGVRIDYAGDQADVRYL